MCGGYGESSRGHGKTGWMVLRGCLEGVGILSRGYVESVRRVW